MFLFEMQLRYVMTSRKSQYIKKCKFSILRIFWLDDDFVQCESRQAANSHYNLFFFDNIAYLVRILYTSCNATQTKQHHIKRERYKRKCPSSIYLRQIDKYRNSSVQQRDDRKLLLILSYTLWILLVEFFAPSHVQKTRLCSKPRLYCVPHPITFCMCKPRG